MALGESSIAAVERQLKEIDNEIDSYEMNLFKYHEIFEGSEWFPFYTDTVLGREMKEKLFMLASNMKDIKKELENLCDETYNFLNKQKNING